MRTFVIFTVVATSVCALPEQPVIVSGSAATSSSMGTLEVMTGEHAVIHWDQFSIAAAERVEFVQPSAMASVLNRVVGGAPSELLGQLHANGRVYLVNPHGVVIGSHAVIEASSFLASTLDVALDTTMWASAPVLFEGSSTATIVNHGTIQALDGHVILVGHVVENHGTIRAPNGQVAIATGGSIWLRLQDEPLLIVRRDIESDAHLTAAGSIEAMGIELQSAGAAYTYGVNVEGVVTATHPVQREGRIYLSAGSLATAKESAMQGSDVHISTDQGMLYLEGSICADKVVIDDTANEKPLFQLGTITAPEIVIHAPKCVNAGTIDATADSGGTIAIHTKGPYIETSQGRLIASGNRQGGSVSLVSDGSIFSSGTMEAIGGTGGSITLQSDQLTLVSAQLDASGTNAGGSIYLQGRIAHLGGDTAVRASAREEGNGGSISVIGDERTVAWGMLEANGGAMQGNGGQIEVSSLGELACSANLSARAFNGQAGVVCLDPKNIVISATTGVYPQYQFIDPNVGSGSGFGALAAGVIVLPSGNVAITKSSDNLVATASGASYLYNGITAALISTITGSTASDQVGEDGYTALTNGNYVIISPNWDSGSVQNVGAVTWASGSTGVSGVVSASNSLIGSTLTDQVGSTGVAALTNGNYVVRSSNWDNGGVTNVGAVTWCDGTTGRSGVVSTANSLYGAVSGDFVGITAFTALTNGNYVVISALCDNGAVNTAGAATWGNGTTGSVGALSTSNSLMGSTTSDLLTSTAIALTNGNYVVRIPNWDNGATTNVGAATWGDGTIGVSGTISSSNSLIGSTASDQVGNTGVIALTNGNYVVITSGWDNGATANVGAVTWCDGTTGRTGTISSSNSLIGSTVTDQVGSGGVTALTNGHYVVRSSGWDNGATSNVGAATWCDGTTGRTGAVSAANSLIGSTATDIVSSSAVTALTNGHYVVASSSWINGGLALAGAVTWCDGTTGRVGTVSTSNSLVGSAANNSVGSSGVVALTNGNYVVRSPNWDNGGTTNVGAATWGNGATGTTGSVSVSNSLIGSIANDQVSTTSVTALTNGNYVVASGNWNNGSITTAGAVTWGDGTSGTTGVVSTTNSIVGSTNGDNVGSGAVLALSNGNYVVCSPNWDNGSVSNAGAATLCSGTGGTVGALSAQNSIVGPSTSSTLATTMREDTVSQTFICRFVATSVAKVMAGLYSASQITFNRGQAQTMSIPPSLITTVLNAGTDLVLQANNDITISSAITSSNGAANLTLRAGRSIFIDANLTTGNASWTLIANDPLSSGVVDAYRDAGDAEIRCAVDTVIDAGTGAISLSLLNGEGKTYTSSGDITFRSDSTVQASGPGNVSIFAQDHNIVLETGATMEVENGTLNVTAGQSIIVSAPTIEVTGSGGITLISDNLYLTAPSFGSGGVSLDGAELLTNGGKLLIYTSERSLNNLPARINDVAYVPGPEFVDSITEKWGVYYPSSSGVPFTIFYKNTGTSSVQISGLYSAITGASEPFQRWDNPWYDDLYLSADRYAPYLTPKGLKLRPSSLITLDEASSQVVLK